MEDSIFTRIIKGEIPSFKIYEDEHTVAFLDIHPLTPGHTLIVPKKQIPYLWDADEETYAYLMAAVKTVGDHLKDVLPQKYLGVKVIGVDVAHAHVHLVPFDSVDDYEGKNRKEAYGDESALKEIAETISLL